MSHGDPVSLINEDGQRCQNEVRLDENTTAYVQTRTDESVDVFVQDQNTPIVNMPLHQDLGNFTLAIPAVPNTYTFTAAAGHGIVIGNVVFLIQGAIFFYATVLNVVVNVITLDTPICNPFTVTATGIRSNGNANVNGSVAPVVFHAQPPPGVPAWDITRLSIKIVDNAAMDDTTFGGIAAGLTRGIHLRKNNGDGTFLNVGNAKTNGNLRWLCEDAQITEKVGGGEWQFTAKCIFQPSVGVTFRLNPALGEELEVLVQDDLTALIALQFVAQGHVVEN